MSFEEESGYEHDLDVLLIVIMQSSCANFGFHLSLYEMRLN